LRGETTLLLRGLAGACLSLSVPDEGDAAAAAVGGLRAAAGGEWGMGCATSRPRGSATDGGVGGGGRRGAEHMQWSAAEELWAQRAAPGRVQLSRRARLLGALPPALLSHPCTGCCRVHPITEERALQLKAMLAQQLNRSERPSSLGAGGRSKSYRVGGGTPHAHTQQVVVQGVVDLAAGFDAPVEELTDHAYPDNVTAAAATAAALTSTSPRRVTFERGGSPGAGPAAAAPPRLQLLPGAVIKGAEAAAAAAPIRRPQPLQLVCPPPDPYAKPAFGALPSCVVESSVDELVATLSEGWGAERQRDLVRVRQEVDRRRRSLRGAFGALRDAGRAAAARRRDERAQQTQLWYRALRKQTLERQRPSKTAAPSPLVLSRGQVWRAVLQKPPLGQSAGGVSGWREVLLARPAAAGTEGGGGSSSALSSGQRASADGAAAAVSHSCVCIGSPCLRHCVHDASIGGGGGGSLVGPAHASRLR
jgi:hypothetical protein